MGDEWEHRAPIPVAELVRRLGFQVLFLFDVDDDFSGMVAPLERLMGINGRHHHHRQRFSISHELAHVQLKHPPESACSRAEIAHFNIEADIFAGELLVPEGVFLKWKERTTRADVLASVFDVSEDVIRKRLLQDRGLLLSNAP